jgi:maltoporin
MKKHLSVLILPLLFTLQLMAQQNIISNKKFSIGTYGRVGIAYGIGIEGNYPRSLNLNGMGSIGGRFEEGDYFELATALHFTPTSVSKDTTQINVQARLAFYTTQGQIIGNVTSKSIGGITAAIPELFVEAKNINGSPWSLWVGARFFRGDDIHIIDHFYFDDHSAQGFGVTYKNTQFAIIFPGTIDTSSAIPPYFYLNIVNGTPLLGLRNRTVSVLQHIMPVKDGYLELLGEFHRLAGGESTDTVSQYNYPAASGWVVGAKYQSPLGTILPGSFNAVSVRYGAGIANGGDGGATKTFLTYGGPNLTTQNFKQAWSLAITETILWNINNKYAINGYGIFTKSQGASDSLNKTPNYTGTQMFFNRKTDLAFGARGTLFINNWFHLLHELDFAWRKDGTQEAAQLIKFTIAPTFVPDGKRDVWSRPHIRLVYSVGRYNQFAANNLYSPYLQQGGSKRWGQYLGVKAEWWLW